MVFGRLFRYVIVTAVLMASAHEVSAQIVDPTFDPGTNGWVSAIAVQADNKILIGGFFSGVGGSTGTTPRLNIARLNPDGTVDASFNPGANGVVRAITVQPDGKILVGGYFSGLGGGSGTVPRLRIGRLLPDGSVDADFNPGVSNGGLNGQVFALVLQADGRILVGGAFTGLGEGTGATPRLNVGRLDASGTVDDGFNPGASGGSDTVVAALAVQPDDNILVGGRFTGLGGGTGSTPRLNIGRVDADGVVDGGFNPGTNNQGVTNFALQPDGRIIVAGVFTMIGGGTGTSARNGIARLEVDGTVDDGYVSPQWYTAYDSVSLQVDGRLVPGQNILRRLNSDGSLDPGFVSLGGETQALALDREGRLLVAGSFTSLGQTTRRSIGRLLNPTAPSESLVASPDGTELSWLRGGSLPEVSRVHFSTSIDGVAYTDLGAGVRIPGGWALTGLTLAPHPNRIVRARGYYSTGLRSGSGSIVQTEAPLPVTNVIENGDFDTSTTGWLQFSLPDASGIVSNTSGGVFQFYRNGTQAVVFQQTGMPFTAGAPIAAQFALGNSDPVRKRISVLVHDQDFADLSVCTFWLPASSPLTTYGMQTHTTRPWTGATISFYAASAGSSGGYYLLDDVTLQYATAESANRTDCLDPTAPTPPGGPDEADLLLNGDFASGTLAPGWSTFGQIGSQVAGGVFEFIKNAGTPAGVLLQPTGQTMTAGQILTAAFELGNSSGVRKRVTVLLHDNDFTDLSACTFWLRPGQPLTTYTYRTFATQAWTNATLSVYPATVGADQWIRFDNATLQRTPGSTIAGTECMEPGGVPDALADAAAGIPSLPFIVQSVPRSLQEHGTRGGDTNPMSGWVSDGFVAEDETFAGRTGWVTEATGLDRHMLTLAEPFDLSEGVVARLRLESWLSAETSRAWIDVSADGQQWDTVFVVDPSDTWIPIEVDLSPYVGGRLHVRFVFVAGAPRPGSAPDTWRIEAVGMDVDGASLTRSAGSRVDTGATLRAESAR